MEEMVTSNFYDRFEEQKSKGGDRGPLDSSEDDSSESSDDSEEKDKKDRDQITNNKKISILKQFNQLIINRRKAIVQYN